MIDLKFNLKTDEHQTTVNVVQNEDNQVTLPHTGEIDITIYIDLDGRLCADVLDINQTIQVIPMRFAHQIGELQ